MTASRSELNDERKDLLHAITGTARQALERNQSKGTWQTTHPTILLVKAREEWHELLEALSAGRFDDAWADLGDVIVATAMLVHGMELAKEDVS